MSKKSNKKSAKSKTSKKKTVKKKAAKKPARKAGKPAKKAKAKKAAPKKKIVAKKKSAKKPVSKKVKAKKAVKKPVKKIIKKAVKKSLKPVKKAAPIKVVKSKSAPLKVAAAKKPVKVEAKPNISLATAVTTPEIKTPAPAVKAKKGAKPAPKKIFQPPRKSVVIDIKTGPEPAGRFELEYVVHSSAPILFEFLTSPSGLSEWFCDDVNIRNGIYSFKWEENEQQARVVKLIEEKHVRFQWVDKQDNSYFEFRVERDDLTNDISLIVADFAESAEEQSSSTLLWNSQIAKLLHQLGSYF